MKNLVKRQWLFLFAFTCVVVVTSCNDDDDEVSVKQGFRVDEKKYSLTQAYTTISDQGDEEQDLYSHQIILAGDGLEVTEGPEFNGSSDVVNFYLYSGSEVLAEGEYIIRETPNEPDEASLVVAYVNLSADEIDQDYERAFVGTGGRVIVSKDGDQYTVEVKCAAVLTIISATGTTPLFIPTEGDLRIQYKGEITNVSPDEDGLRKPKGRNLFFP
jgi:hypothetical protein